MDGPGAQEGAANDTLIILAISLLSCFLVPCALWLFSQLACRSKADDDSVPKQLKAARRILFFLVLGFTLVGTAIVLFLANRLTGIVRQFNPYDVLGIADGASSAAVRSAYRRLALTAHPDKGGDAVAFQRIVKAYETLTDPAQREAWEAGASDDFDPRANGRTGLEDITVQSGGGKAVVLIYMVVLFVALPLGIIAFRKSGRGGPDGGGGGGYYDGGGGADGLTEEEQDMRRALEAASRRIEKLDKKEQKEAAERALAREKAAVEKAIRERIRKQQAADEAEIQRRRKEEEDSQRRAVEEMAADMRRAAKLSDASSSSSSTTASGGDADPARSGSSNRSSWSAAEVSALAKAIGKYPGGARNRWTMIATFVSSAGAGRSADDCIAKAKEIVSQRMNARSNAAASATSNSSSSSSSTPKGAPERDSEDSGGGTGAAPASAAAPSSTSSSSSSGSGGDEPWTDEQQRCLEDALRSIPPSQDNRWAAVAACVPGKSAKQCVARFKTLRALLLAKQQHAGGAS